MKLTKKEHEMLRDARRSRLSPWQLWAPAVLGWVATSFVMFGAYAAGNLTSLASSLTVTGFLTVTSAMLSQQQAQLSLIATLQDALDRGERIEPEDRRPVLHLT